MKTVLICLLAVGSVASACPGLSPNTYTEVSVPCNGSQPDESQPVAVNQADSNGGECRVQLQSGEYFQVNGSDLYIVGQNGGQRQVGVLLGTPSCYQTDPGDAYSSNWVAVQLTP